MSPRDPQNQAEIEAFAAELLTRRDAGWTSTEAAEFALWRAADPRHEAAVRRLEATQRMLAQLPESPAAAAMRAELDELCRPPARTTPLATWLKMGGALAAAAALAFIAWTVVPKAPPPAALSIATASGQPRTVPLTDGSTLLLNGGSAVEVEFVADERRISLRQGEVHFSVAKDETRPFIVAAGAVKVRAVGTAFNVRRGSTAVEVIVTEGKVRVSRDDAEAGAAPLLLISGEGTTIDTATVGPVVDAPRLTADAVRERLAWRAPRLDFRGMTLAEAIARINVYSRIQLQIGDPELAGRPVGGTFNADNAELFVNLMQRGGDFRVERVSETRWVLRKAR